MIKFLIEKEFKQLFRNSFLPKLIFIFPCTTVQRNFPIGSVDLNRHHSLDVLV